MSSSSGSFKEEHESNKECDKSNKEEHEKADEDKENKKSKCCLLL